MRNLLAKTGPCGVGPRVPRLRLEWLAFADVSALKITETHLALLYQQTTTSSLRHASLVTGNHFLLCLATPFQSRRSASVKP
jgi:hypothetical protein